MLIKSGTFVLNVWKERTKDEHLSSACWMETFGWNTEFESVLNKHVWISCRSVSFSTAGFLPVADRTGTAPDAPSFLHLLYLFLFCNSATAPVHVAPYRTGWQYQAPFLVVSFVWLPFFLFCVLTDDLLGKRKSFSPNSSSECPSDSKKSRSVSPKGKAARRVCLL